MTEFDNLCSENEFDINNAGYYRLNDMDSFTNRPTGRIDWQMLFVKSGFGYFTVNGVEHKVEPNHLILYRPNEPQFYRFSRKDDTLVYWVHFTGTKAADYIQNSEFSNSSIIDYDSSDFTDTVEVLINELRQKNTMYKQYCSAKLIAFLVKLNRLNDNLFFPKKYEHIEKVCNYISDNYFVNVSNDLYASMCNLSTSYFLKEFKAFTGTTPHQYKIALQLENSKKLLLSSDYTLEQIGTIVGFSDVTYFSRFFKKNTGLTPSDFRRKSQRH